MVYVCQYTLYTPLSTDGDSIPGWESVLGGVWSGWLDYSHADFSLAVITLTRTYL